MHAITRFSVLILAGLEALLTVLGHPDWAVALWAVATAPAQAARVAIHEPGQSPAAGAFLYQAPWP